MASATAVASFPTIKNRMKRDKLVRLLLAIVAATVASTEKPYGFLAEKDADELLAANGTLIEVKKELREDATKADSGVAVHATALGVAAANAIQVELAAAPAEIPEVAAVAFEIESDVPLPVIVRGGGYTKYPFDKMEQGQSFFVAASVKAPNPSKSLASTVNSANKRYKTAAIAPALPRKFALRADKKGDVEGARVFRIQ